MPVTLAKLPNKDCIVSLFRQALWDGTYASWVKLYDALVDIPDNDPGYQAFLYFCPFEDLTTEPEIDPNNIDWEEAIEASLYDEQVKVRDAARHELIEISGTEDRRNKLVGHFTEVVGDMRPRVFAAACTRLDTKIWEQIRDCVVKHIVYMASEDNIDLRHIHLLERTIESFPNPIDAGLYLHEKFGETELPKPTQEILRNS